MESETGLAQGAPVHRIFSAPPLRRAQILFRFGEGVTPEVGRRQSRHYTALFAGRRAKRFQNPPRFAGAPGREHKFGSQQRDVITLPIVEHHAPEALEQRLDFDQSFATKSKVGGAN